MQRSVPSLNDFAVEHVAQYGQRLWRKLLLGVVLRDGWLASHRRPIPAYAP